MRVDRRLALRPTTTSCSKWRSDWQNVISGVHKGSVLGPMLSNIYVNDLEAILCHKYQNSQTIQNLAVK